MYGWLAASALAVPSVDEPLRSGLVDQPGAAVVVGIEDYAFLPDVPYAGRDAATLVDILVHVVGLKPDHVAHLKTANREQLLDAVRSARDRAGDGPVYVFFAGHGATSPEGALLLVGDDAKADAAVFVARSVSVPELLAAAGPLPVLWLDTCYAGVGRGGEALVPGARFAIPAYATTSTGEVWTAASPTEVSLPYVPAKHGLFTYFLAGGLRGWADGELGAPDGAVDSDELWAFVQRGLRAVDAKQTPQRAGAIQGRLWSIGHLELAPDPSEWPRVGAAITLPASGGGDVPAPSGAITLTPPFVLEGRVARDSAGRAASFGELAQLGLGPDVAEAERRMRAARGVGVGSAVVAAAVAASTVGLVVSRASAQASWSSYQRLCAQGLRVDAQCDAAQPPGAMPLVLGGVGISSGALVVSGIGFGKIRKSRERVIDRANEVLR